MILDKNRWRPVEEIKDIRVLETVKEGRTVWKASTSGKCSPNRFHWNRLPAQAPS